MREEYEVNKDFREYVDKYCRKHGKSVEEALRDVLVAGVGEQYRERRLTVKEVVK